MSEDELANGAPPADAEAIEGGAAASEEELDEEALALLKDMEESQQEVQRMIQAQRDQQAELGGMKEQLASELQELQDDAWKLQVFAELEMLKRQLAALNNLDADLDALEAKLDEGGEEAMDKAFEEELEAARAGTRDILSKYKGATRPANGSMATAEGASGPAGDAARAPAADAEEGEEELGDVDALQDELDAELAEMQKQLQAIKAESALVATRKAQLELELMQLIRDGADELAEQLEGMGVQEADGQTKAEDAAAPVAPA